jgi:hypothetical protein
VALLGSAVLAIWNGIEEGAEAEFVRWHIKEHIPERVGLPGFRRGRRYVALEGTPRFFNFYETDGVETLTSESYIARLNAPTPWTRQVVAQFRDTIRTVCRVVASSGIGQGAWVEAVRIVSGANEHTLGQAFDQSFVNRVTAFDGVVAAHVLKGQPDQSRRNTAESALRGSPDRLVDWVVLIEAAEAESLRAIRNTSLWAEVLGDAAVERGIYRLQYALSREDLAESAGGATNRS